MKLRRIVFFRASGIHLTEFINAVRNSDIVCISLRYSHGEYTGRIYYTDIDYLRNTAQNYGVELYVEEYNKSLFRVFRYRMRYGIVAGVLFTALFIFYMSNTVVRIEVNGNSAVNESQILNALKETGVKHGAFIPFLDLSESEIMIRKEIGSISWAAVRNRGGRIIVDVKEADISDGSVHSNIPCSIVSLKNAQIVSLKPYRGMCMLNEGDAVAEGDVLISGILTNGANNYKVIHAEGEVTGDYEDEQIFVRYFNSTAKEYTSTLRKKWLYFFGFRIPLSVVRGNMGGQADYSEHTDFLNVYEYELPLGIVNAEYKAYDFVKKNENEEELHRNLAEQVERYERNFYSKCEIRSRKIKENIYDDRIEYDVKYLIRGPIGMEKIFFPGKEEKADITVENK